MSHDTAPDLQRPGWHQWSRLPLTSSWKIWPSLYSQCHLSLSLYSVVQQFVARFLKVFCLVPGGFLSVIRYVHTKYLCLFLFVGHVMSPPHSDQISQVTSLSGRSTCYYVYYVNVLHTQWVTKSPTLSCLGIGPPKNEWHQNQKLCWLVVGQLSRTHNRLSHGCFDENAFSVRNVETVFPFQSNDQYSVWRRDTKEIKRKFSVWRFPLGLDSRI